MIRRRATVAICPCCGHSAEPITLAQVHELVTASREQIAQPTSPAPGPIPIDLWLAAGLLSGLPWAAAQFLAIATDIGGPDTPTAGLTFAPIVDKLLPIVMSGLKWIAPLPLLGLAILTWLEPRQAHNPETLPPSRPIRSRALMDLWICSADGVIFDLVSGKRWPADGTAIVVAGAVPATAYAYSRLHRAHARNWSAPKGNRTKVPTTLSASRGASQRPSQSPQKGNPSE